MSMSPTTNYFAEFKRNHRIFIETGSYRGDGIQLAIDAGYDEIYSIDNDKANVDYCAQRFDADSRVTLLHGNSPEVLHELLQGVTEPVMFWLDAHSQMFEGEEDNYPLLAELVAIQSHHIKNHSILIDDFLMMTHPDVTGWMKEIIISGLSIINSEYHYEYLSNPIKNNVLYAYI
jgi:hypothetical protein